MDNPIGRDDEYRRTDIDNQTETNRLDSLARHRDLTTISGGSEWQNEAIEVGYNELNPLLSDKFRGSKRVGLATERTFFLAFHHDS